MKLVSYRRPGCTPARLAVGVVRADGRIVDVQSAYAELLTRQGASEAAAWRMARAQIPDDMVAFIEGGPPARRAAEAAVQAVEDDRYTYAWDAVARTAPVPQPPLLRDFMAFENHLQNIYPRLGRAIPPEWYQIPVYYKGNPASTGTDGDPVVFPPGSAQWDFELELAIVIGRTGANIPRDRAMDFIYGYMIYNDFSARSLQTTEMAVGLGPAKGKDFMGGHVFGPWLVTADEIPDPYNLTLEARVNGALWCRAESGTMHWRLEDLIVHASRHETIRAGEVWGIGTVGGGSMSEKGAELQPGDIVELTVTGLGRLRNVVKG